MYSMPSSSGSDEPIASDSERQEDTAVRISQELLIWTVRLFAVAYLIGLCIYLWEDEEMRLRIYYYIIKCFQTVARIAGSVAIVSEQKYYEIVDTLH